LRYFFQCARSHHAQQSTHGRRLNLKNTQGASFGDDGAGGWVVFGDSGEINDAGFGAGSYAVGRDGSAIFARHSPLATRHCFFNRFYFLYFFRRFFDVVESKSHGGEAALAKQIHLDKSERFDGVHVVLRDDDALRRALQRDEMRQRARGNHRATRVNAEMPRRIIQP